MKKILHHIKTFTFFYLTLTLLIGVIIGVVFSLSYEAVRYTRHIQPSTLESSPEGVYKYTQENPGKYLFLDVRTIGEYENLHAVNSISNPIGHLFDDWHTLPRDKNTKIFLICTTGKLASIAYGYLQLHGFTNIVHVDGGLEKWVSEGLPVNRGANKVDYNFSLDRPVGVVATSSLNK